MNPDLTKLLALLDSVIAAGEKATPRPWAVHADNGHGSAHVYAEPSFIKESTDSESGNPWNYRSNLVALPYSVNDNSEHIGNNNFIVLSANLSPLMAETLKDTLGTLQFIADNGRPEMRELALTRIIETTQKWKHLL
jgi:hypothetical protein